MQILLFHFLNIALLGMRGGILKTSLPIFNTNPHRNYPLSYRAIISISLKI